MPAEPPFKLFGPAHLTVIGITILLPVLLAWRAKQPGSERFTRVVRYALAAMLLVNWIAYALFRVARGEFTPALALPMHLCDWATATVIMALVADGRAMYELSYFWGLGGTFQAILTPNIQVTFPNPRFISFFIAHSGIVVAVLFLTMALKLRPRPGSILRTFLWSEVYMVCALAVNALTGGNYGFLTHKPEGASLLDFLSRNHVLYLLEMNLLAVLF